MTRTALALDEASNDICLDDSGSIAMVYDAKAIGQHARQRLQTHFGEWYLDTSCGVAWLSEIFAKSYDPEMAESVIKEELLNTDGIEGIEDFSVSFNHKTRGIIIKSISVNTIFDEVTSI